MQFKAVVLEVKHMFGHLSEIPFAYVFICLFINLFILQHLGLNPSLVHAKQVFFPSLIPSYTEILERCLLPDRKN